jgi:hypothetical protein
MLATCELGGEGGGAGGGGTLPPDSTAVTPFQEGPLLWAACVLAVVGSVYSVDQVADQFTAWYEAQHGLESAQRILDAIHANSASVTPEMIALYELRYDLAKQRRDDAVSAVTGATNTRGLLKKCSRKRTWIT